MVGFQYSEKKQYGCGALKRTTVALSKVQAFLCQFKFIHTIVCQEGKSQGCSVLDEIGRSRNFGLRFTALKSTAGVYRSYRSKKDALQLPPKRALESSTADLVQAALYYSIRFHPQVHVLTLRV